MRTEKEMRRVATILARRDDRGRRARLLSCRERGRKLAEIVRSDQALYPAWQFEPPKKCSKTAC
jgi:hypothetical protein